MRTQGKDPSLVICHRVRAEIAKEVAASLDVIKKRLPASVCSLIGLRVE
jgi:hypothetical protein